MGSACQHCQLKSDSQNNISQDNLPHLKVGCETRMGRIHNKIERVPHRKRSEYNKQQDEILHTSVDFIEITKPQEVGEDLSNLIQEISILQNETKTKKITQKPLKGIIHYNKIGINNKKIVSQSLIPTNRYITSQQTISVRGHSEKQVRFRIPKNQKKYHHTQLIRTKTKISITNIQ